MPNLQMPPPLPPDIPPPLPPEALEPTPEPAEPRIEAKEYATEDVHLAVTTLSKHDVKPQEYPPAPNEDSHLVNPENNLFAVADGAGGYNAGEVASSLAMENLSAELDKARAALVKLDERQKQALWQEMIEANVPISKDEAEKSPATMGQHRADKMAELTKQLEELNLPEEARLEAMAAYRALQNLSDAIFLEAKKDPVRADMSTTATAIKIVDTEDGRRLAVFFGVGDSEAYIEREDPENPGSRKLERALPSDNVFEFMLARQHPDARRAQKTGDYSDEFIRQARFAATTQLLGQADTPLPHVMIWEIGQNTRFIIASDGLFDSDMSRDYARTLQKPGSWGDKTIKMTKRAVRGFRTKEGKRGADDIVIVAGEIARPERVEKKSPDEIKWATLVEDILNAEGITGGDRERIQDELLAEPVRRALARAAVEEAEGRGITDDEGVTAILREHIGRRVLDLRLEKFEILNDQAAE